MKRTRFEKLAQEFLDADVEFESPIESRIHKRKAQIQLIASCLFFLKERPGDESIIEVLKDNGVKIERDTYFDDIKKAYKKIEQLDFKKRQDESKTKKALTPKKKKKPNEKNSIFDMMTSLSTGLELSLDFNNMVVREFISYKKALKRKRKLLEKSAPKQTNNNGRFK
jgi:hypothetical protein